MLKNFLTTLFCFLFVASALSQSAIDQANQLIQAKKYVESERILHNYLQQQPTDKAAKELYGDALGFQEKWDETIQVYKELMLSDTRNANYFYKYGGAMGMKALAVNKLKAMGMVKDIRNAFTRAAELDPKHIDARWALVEFYMQLPGIIGGSEKKARYYAGELKTLSPVDGYLALGYIAEYNDDFKEAEQAYRKAIEVGGSALTYTKLVDLYEANQEPQKALLTGQECIAAHDNNRMHYQIGKIAATFNMNSDLGIACLHKYIENYTVKDGVPKDWAYYRLAQIYNNQGDKQQATTWVNKALDARPDFKEALKFKKAL